MHQRTVRRAREVTRAVNSWMTRHWYEGRRDTAYGGWLETGDEDNTGEHLLGELKLHFAVNDNNRWRYHRRILLAFLPAF